MVTVSVRVHAPNPHHNLFFLVHWLKIDHSPPSSRFLNAYMDHKLLYSDVLNDMTVSMT